MLKLINIILEKKSFGFKEIFINYCCLGNRSNNLILFYGRVKSYISKSAIIELKNGYLHLNKSARNVEPLTGFLEIGNFSKILVKNNFVIYPGFHIVLLDNSKFILGSGYINRNLKIRCFKEITIGENVAISENVTIWDSDAHVIDGKINEMTAPVIIGNNVWIGNNVVILKGVTIGNGAVIAAGSVVTKSIPENTLAGGVPAKVIRNNVKWK